MLFRSCGVCAINRRASPVSTRRRRSTALRATTRDLGARLTGALARSQERRRTELRSAARALPGPETLLSVPRQRVDLAGVKLTVAARSAVERRRLVLTGLARRLMAQTPQARLARFGEKVRGLGIQLVSFRLNSDRARRKAFETLGQRLHQALAARLKLETSNIRHRRERLAALAERLPKAFAARQGERRQRLTSLDALMNSLGYKQVLARGYALVRNGDGKPIRSVKAIAGGDALEIEFADGRIQASAGGEGARPKPARPQRQTSGGGQPFGSKQGDLF